MEIVKCECKKLRLQQEFRPVTHELEGTPVRVEEVPGYPCLCGKSFYITDDVAKGVRRSAWGAYKQGLTTARFRP